MGTHIKRLPLLLMGFVLVASMVLAVTTSIGAQENDATGGSGLSISPTRTELRIEKGASEVIELNVRNITRGPIIAKPVISDFDADDSTGEPKLRNAGGERSSASIEPFVKGLEDVQLAPGENKNISYTVEIPSDAPSGAYYGAIAYRAVPANQAGPESGEVALTANVAPLILIEVPGDITEQVQVNSVRVSKDGSFGSFFTSQPNNVAIDIKNNGNGFSKPFGTVSITDMSGKEVDSYELNNSTPRSNVLPNSSRTFTDAIEGIKKPGRYTVTANVSHGTGGEVLTQKVSFWYLPVWLLIALAVLLAGIAGAVYFLYRRQVGSKKPSKKSSK